MEANFFRFLAAQLAEQLVGRRIQKVYCPAENTWTFALDQKEFLLFRPAKSVGLLFLTKRKPQNPPHPPARAMYYRKRLADRRIISATADWPGLRLCLELTPKKDLPDAGPSLVLDVRRDLALTDRPDAAFGREPEWPDLDRALSDDQVWRDHPQLSPPLRRRLVSLERGQDRQAAAALLDELSRGAVATFSMGVEEGVPAQPLAWSNYDLEETFTSAAEAARAYGERILFPLLEAEEGAEQDQRTAKEAKRVRRNLEQLERERERLKGLREKKAEAEALQAELYKIKDAEADSVVVSHPEHGPMEVALEPGQTPVEAMQRRFKQAAKAERGFEHIERRKQELSDQLKRIQAGQLPVKKTVAAKPNAEPRPRTIPKRFQDLAAHRFFTSDGFLVVRGKNQQANHSLTTRIASPFDLWLHVADGPSSHLILKRDFPDQEVPRQSLVEAAVLCALKSFRKDDAKADVMVAEARHVKAIKGAPPGRVSVEETLETIRVDIDPTLEAKLAAD